jgi:16S rRNA (guanine(966)-N(2))-methyltransferase RsmD
MINDQEVRIIGGTYRGRRLRAPAGLDVRPTSDRLRETLFNIIAPRVTGSRFLDICAGSGAVGIEALSRGAASATFIEQSRRACAAIGSNLESLGISDAAAVINRDAAAALRGLEAESLAFDIIYFDPPYASGIYSQVIGLLSEGSIIAEDGILVVEHRRKQPPEAERGNLKMYRVVRQGESALAFYSGIGGQGRLTTDN